MLKDIKSADIRIRAMKYLHITLVVCSFYLSWLLFRFGRLTNLDSYGFRYNYFVAALYGICFYFFARTYNAYMLGYFRVRKLVLAQIMSELFSLIIVYLATAIAWNQWNNPTYLLIFIPVQVAIDIIWSLYVNDLYFRLYPAQKAVVVYKNESDLKRLDDLNSFPLVRKYSVDRKVQNPKDIEQVLEGVDGYDVVIVAGLEAELMDALAKYCKMNCVNGYFIPHIGDILLAGGYHMQNFSTPVMYVGRTNPKPEYLFIKRVFDIFASLIGIVVLSPFMLITALAIKLYDKGPIIYKQKRLTINAREFDIYKFRSMRVDAEKDGVALLAKENDDRITPIGKIIRTIRFDELPQLFNILKGDMTIVGPRPERPEIAAEYEKTLPDFPLRLQVKAGLTGYAQVYGRYNSEPYEKLEFDLLYMNNMNILTDLQLMFATIGILFKKDSTQGFKD